MVNSQTNENTLMAVYLEKFSLFITWPEEAGFHNSDEPFIISVYKDDAMYDVLEQVYEYRKINEKTVEVRNIITFNQIGNSHILFIGDITKESLSEIVGFTSSKGLLMVSATKGFAQEGIHINFYNKNNKLRFEINEGEVLKSPLKLSFYLMSSAKIVNPVKEK